METKIYVDHVRRNPDTGHISIRLMSQTTHEGATWFGPTKDYGLDTHVFYERFNGNTEQLMNYLASEHKAFIGRHDGLTDELTKLEGKQIG